MESSTIAMQARKCGLTGLEQIQAEGRKEMTEDRNCNSCDRKAEIFQAEGHYCLQCWQSETHPNV